MVDRPATEPRRSAEPVPARAPDGRGPTRQPSAGVAGAVAPVVVGLLVGGLFVGVYLAAFHDPQPHDLPVGVVAPASVVSSLEAGAAADGGLQVRTYPDRASARSAVADRTVLGALVIGPGAPELLVAGANGPSVTQTLQGALGPAAGASVAATTTTDVSPLGDGDSRGLSIFYAAFGVVVAGFLFGLTSMQIGPDLSPWSRAASTAVFSALVGLVVAWLVQPVFGALPAPFPVTAAVVGLLALAVGATTAAMYRAFGPPGVLIAAVVLLVFGNATSTGILPAQYLPSWLEPLAPVLPVGVAVRALRGAAYFADDGLVTGLLVLTAWVVAAVVLFAAAARLRRRSGPEPAGSGAAAIS